MTDYVTKMKISNTINNSVSIGLIKLYNTDILWFISFFPLKINKINWRLIIYSTLITANKIETTQNQKQLLIKELIK